MLAKIKTLPWWKKTGLVLLALVLIFIILGIVLPKNVHVTVTDKVNAPANYVFNYLNDIRNNTEWNPWIEEDPEMKLSFEEPHIGEGASYSWTSEKSGNGTMNYLSVMENRSIETEVLFEGFSPSTSIYTIDDTGPETSELSWSFESKLGFPFNVFGFVFKMMIRKSYKKGLKNISNFVEKRFNDGIYNNYTVVESFSREINYGVTRLEVPVERLRQFSAQTHTVLYTDINNSDLTITGKPSVLFYSDYTRQNNAEIAVAVPVNKALNYPGINPITLEAGQTVYTEHMGDLESIGAAHRAIRSFLRDRKKAVLYPFIEEYVTDPSIEPEASKWLTNITYYFEAR
jgi:effector-binding domain-containing protein